MYNIEEMKKLKQTYGLSYQDVADLSDMSISTVQKLLGGIVKSPRKQTIVRLSKAFEEYIRANDPARPYRIEGYEGKEWFAEKDGDRYIRESSSYGHMPQTAAGMENPVDSVKGKEYGGTDHRRTMTYRDYIGIDVSDGRRMELIDGVLYDMSAPTTRHQEIAGEIFFSFKEYIRRNNGTCKVFMAPVDVRLEADREDTTVLQPDLLIVCDKEKLRDERCITGAPDYVCEILSPATRKQDMYIKLNKYQENGVREYWIIDPDAEKVIKYDFFHDDRIYMYTFDDRVPVEIYEGELDIDFKQIKAVLTS